MKMSLKKILLCATLYFAIAPANAQAPKLSMLRTGPGIAFFSGTNAASSVPAFGFNIGLALSVQLSEQFYVKPEIALAKKGGKLEYTSQSIYSGYVQYRVYYLDLPVMIGARISDTWAIEAGGYGALKLGATFNFQGTFAAGYGTFNSDVLNRIDYGLAGGIVFKSRFLLIGLRYTHGLNPVVSNTGNSSATLLLGNAANNTFQLSIQKVRWRDRKSRK